MALVKKPTDDENLSFDAKKDNDSVIALDESGDVENQNQSCLLYTSPSPRDA